jgi:hypothetical protein
VYYIAYNFMGANIPKRRYVACFTADDGVYSCEHNHKTVREAMDCLVPNGGSFVRALDAGVSRSLNDREFIDFLEALQEMPWRSKEKAVK